MSVEKDQNGSFKKRPIVRKGENWQDVCLTEEQSRRFKNIALSPPKGTIVIDLDTHKGVTREDVDRVLGCKLQWHRSFLQKTISGGEHHLFRLFGSNGIKQGNDLFGLVGFDIKIHMSGNFTTGAGYQNSPNVVGSIYNTVFNNSSLFPVLPLSAAKRLKVKDRKRSLSLVTEPTDEQSLKASSRSEHRSDLSSSEVLKVLEGLPKEWSFSEEKWSKTIAALALQYGDDKEGLSVAHEFSKLCPEKYEEKAVDEKYRYFLARSVPEKPFTLRTLVSITDYKLMVDRNDREFIQLKESCKTIATVDEYNEIITKLSAKSNALLPIPRRKKLSAILNESPYCVKEDIKKAEINLAISTEANPHQETEDKCSLVTTGKPKWAECLVYNKEVDEFFDTDKKRHISAKSINIEHAHKRAVKEANGLSASSLLTKVWEIQTTDFAIYYPTEKPIFNIGRFCCCNTFYDDSITMDGGYGLDDDGNYTDKGKWAVNVFKKHLDILIPVEEERVHFVNYLAKTLKDVGCKIPHAILMRGAEGDGKTYFARLFTKIIGQTNVTAIEGKELTDNFDAWKTGNRLVFVEEMRMSGKDKYFIHDTFKPVISNTDIRVRKMYVDSESIKNFTNYVMFTNHKDAVPIDDSDTRYYIIFTRFNLQKDIKNYFGGVAEMKAYYSDLYETLMYPAAIRKYFEDEVQEPEDFDCHRAPMSASKRRLIGAVEVFGGGVVKGIIEDNECSVLNDQVICSSMLLKLAGVHSKSKEALSIYRELTQMGYEKAARCRVAGRLVRYWTKNIEEEEAREIMRDYYEAVCGGTVTYEYS